MHLHERGGTVLPFSSIQSDPDPPMRMNFVARPAPRRMAGKAVNTNLSPGLLRFTSEHVRGVYAHLMPRVYQTPLYTASRLYGE